MHNWVVALDNVSGISDWLSDALARLATGAGFSTRRLYTDSEEFNSNVTRPVMLNGIGDVINRSDLLDRALLVHLAPISEETRRLEADFWADFDHARPLIIGALLDVVSGALGRVDSVQLASWPRMADFARFVTAAEPALRWETGAFLKAYYANRGSAHELALDADPVAVALRDLVAAQGLWEGRPTALLDRLGELAGDAIIRQKAWPKAAHVLTNRLERLAPNLRSVGIHVEHSRTGNQRIVAVRHVPTPERVQSPSQPSDADDASNASSKIPPERSPVDWQKSVQVAA